MKFLIKVVLVLLVLGVILARLVLPAFVASQDPLSADRVTARTNGAARGDKGTAVLAPDGRVYLATTLHNEGRLAVELLDTGDPDAHAIRPYVASEILLGDGKTPDPATGAAANGFELQPGSGVGVIVVLVPNPSLDCEAVAAMDRLAITGFNVRIRTFGVEALEHVELGKDAISVAPPTVRACELAIE